MTVRWIILIGLAALSTEAAAEPAEPADPFVTHVLEGPFASPEAYCKQWLARPDADRDSAKGEDACAVDEDAKATLDGHAVRIIVAGWTSDQDIHKQWHQAALQLPDGWWIGPTHSIDSPGGTATSSMALTLGTLRIVNLGGVKAVVIPDRETNTNRVRGDDLVVATASDEIALCAIGKSGRPSCTGSIVVAGSTDETETHGATHSAWGLTPSFPGKGRIKLSKMRKKGHPDKPDTAPGTHTLSFP